MKPLRKVSRKTTPVQLRTMTRTKTASARGVANRARISDDSANPPRLRIAHNWWSLIGLPRGRPEWPVEEKFRRVKEAEFEGIEIWVEEKDEARYHRLLDQTGLFLGIGGHPNTVADFRRLVAQGKRLRAAYLFVHVGHAFMSDDETVKLVRAGYKISTGEGLPMTLETHRGTVTQDLYRTYRLLDRLPEVRLTGDFSHYAVAGEMGGLPAPEQLRRLSPLFDRVDTMHARISNGEQVQMDVGSGDGPLAQTWVEIWAETFRHWRKHARQGDWFSFSSELGPPNYSIQDLQGREISDRWKQSLVVKSLIKQAWAKSQV